MLLAVSLLATAHVALASADFPRGVNPRDQHKYNPVRGDKFKCLTSGELIPHSDLNDNYCDCADGSDEPGTSACSHLSKTPKAHVGFWCRNAGHVPEVISPMIVDDGICDCCDGADEPAGFCKNTCDVVGAQDRARREEEMKELNAGLEIKKQWINEADAAHKDKLKELTELQIELEELKTKTEDLKKVKEDTCAIEKEEKTRCIKADEERKAAEAEAKKKERVQNAYNMLDVDKDGILQASEVQQFPILNPDNTTEEFTVQMAQVLLDGESSNPQNFQDVTWDLIAEHFNDDGYLPGHEPTEAPEPEIEAPPVAEPADGDSTDTTESHGDENDDSIHTENDLDEDDDYNPLSEDEDWDEEDFDDDDFDDEEETVTKKPKWQDNRDYDDYDDDAAAKEYAKIFDDKASEAIKAANKARSELTTHESKIKQKENQVSKLEDMANFDFGPDKAFYNLYDKCIELRTTEYIYKLCGFKKASQKSVSGGSETSLGTFQNWEGSDYTKQHYGKGMRCWNGPDRSCNVVFSCGKENAVLEASEPQRCEYEFRVTTPAACHPTYHDEL